MQIVNIGFLDPKNIHLDTRIKLIAAFDPQIIANVDFNGGHFEIQYGGHKERIPSGPISENVRSMLMYMCAKFGACITKRTILLNIWAKPPCTIPVYGILNSTVLCVFKNYFQNFRNFRNALF